MPSPRWACAICGYCFGETEEESLRIAKECEAKGLPEKPICDVGDVVGINVKTVKIERIYPARVTHKLCYGYTDGRPLYVGRESIGAVYGGIQNRTRSEHVHCDFTEL